jgi:hypothetical protein
VRGGKSEEKRGGKQSDLVRASADDERVGAAAVELR